MDKKFFADSTGRQNALKYMQALSNPNMREGLSFWDYNKSGPEALEYAAKEAGGFKEDDPVLRALLAEMFKGQFGDKKRKIDEQGWTFGSKQSQDLLSELGI